MKVYVIGSLRNPQVVQVGNQLRALGIDAFDDWHGGGPEADDHWKHYEQTRGRSYKEALYDRYATHIWEFDKCHLDSADAAVLVHPVGRSAHIELGYMIGREKPTYVYFHEDLDDDRWDVMYRFATDVFFHMDELVETFQTIQALDAMEKVDA